jgi:hypothetical protein
MPAGVQGRGPGPHHQAAEVDGVQAVDVLGRVDGQQDRSSSRPAGRGSCTR